MLLINDDDDDDDDDECKRLSVDFLVKYCLFCTIESSGVVVAYVMIAFIRYNSS